MYTGSDLCVHQRFFTGYCTDHSIFTWNNNIDSKWDNRMIVAFITLQ